MTPASTLKSSLRVAAVISWLCRHNYLGRPWIGEKAQRCECKPTCILEGYQATNFAEAPHCGELGFEKWQVPGSLSNFSFVHVQNICKIVDFL